MTLPLLLSAMAGLATGLFFFGGLWWTVSRLPRSRAPYRLMFVSWLVRMGVVVAVVRLLIDGGHWERGVAAVVGVLIARSLLIRRIGLRPEPLVGHPDTPEPSEPAAA